MSEITSESAHRYFTNRLPEKKTFRAELDKPLNKGGDTPEHRIFVWHGPGGQGKTGLREELYSEIRNRQGNNEDIAVGVLDFSYEPHRSPIEALLQLRLDLGRERLIAFPLFDTAFAQLFALESPGYDIRTMHPGLYRRVPSESAEDFLDWIDSVLRAAAGFGMPLLPGMGLLYKIGHLLKNYFDESRDCDTSTAHRAEIDAMSASELRERLPVYLGRDLHQAMNKEQPPRVVLMADAYEQLFEKRGAMQTLRNDNWVRSLLNEAPGALVTIFTRDKLTWGEVDSKWNAILRQTLLEELSDTDAELFLKEEHVEPASVRARIVEGAQGHPFYLDLAVTQYHDLVAGGRQPGPGEFSDTPGDILPRFLEHLSDDELKQLRYASYPEEIGESLFCDLAEKFLGGAACVDWPQLVRRSFMTQKDNGRACMHALMRKELQDRDLDEQPVLYHRIHEWLFERYNALAESPRTARDIGEEHDRALICAARHLACADARRLPEWILDSRWQKFYDAARWHALSDTFDKVSNESASFAAYDPERAVWVDHHHAHVCQYMKRYDEAKELYERALNTYKAAFGDRKPECATIMQALGDTHRQLDDTAGAERLFEDALKIYEAEPGTYHQRHAEVLCSLAGIHECNGHDHDAETLYRKAQETYEAAGGKPDRDYANFLLKIGRAHQCNGRYDKAEALFRKTLEIYQATLGDRHPGYATISLDLADCLASRGERKEAEAWYEKSVSIYTDSLGPEHPHLGQALHHQAVFWSGDDNKQEMATAQLKRAIAILAAARGDGHEWTRQAREDLQRLQTERRLQ